MKLKFCKIIVKKKILVIIIDYKLVFESIFLSNRRMKTNYLN